MHLHIYLPIYTYICICDKQMNFRVNGWGNRKRWRTGCYKYGKNRNPIEHKD